MTARPGDFSHSQVAKVFDGDGFNAIISYGDCNDIQGGNDWAKKSRDENKQLARRDPGELARRDMVSKR